MEHLIRFDSWLIDHVFQPVSWSIERYTKLNSFGLARIVICITFAYRVVCDVGQRSYTDALICGAISIYLLWLSFVRERQAKPGTMNAQRVRNVSFRLMLILFLVSDFVLVGNDLSFHVADAGWVIAFYLFACEPMPPALKKPEKALAKKRMAPA